MRFTNVLSEMKVRWASYLVGSIFRNNWLRSWGGRHDPWLLDLIVMFVGWLEVRVRMSWSLFLVAVVFFSMWFLMSIGFMMVRFVVFWRADWHMVRHWNFFVDWEFHFFVNDMGSVDWNFDFILLEERRNCNHILTAQARSMSHGLTSTTSIKLWKKRETKIHSLEQVFRRCKGPSWWLHKEYGPGMGP